MLATAPIVIDLWAVLRCVCVCEHVCPIHFTKQGCHPHVCQSFFCYVCTRVYYMVYICGKLKMSPHGSPISACTWLRSAQRRGNANQLGETPGIVVQKTKHTIAKHRGEQEDNLLALFFNICWAYLLHIVWHRHALFVLLSFVVPLLIIMLLRIVCGTIWDSSCFIDNSCMRLGVLPAPLQAQQLHLLHQHHLLFYRWFFEGRYSGMLMFCINIIEMRHASHLSAPLSLLIGCCSWFIRQRCNGFCLWCGNVAK